MPCPLWFTSVVAATLRCASMAKDNLDDSAAGAAVSSSVESSVAPRRRVLHNPKGQRQAHLPHLIGAAHGPAQDPQCLQEGVLILAVYVATEAVVRCAAHHEQR